jgi:hemerythrin-like metal-binding protein
MKAQFDSTFLTGIYEMDSQHYGLFQTLEHFVSASSKGSSIDALCSCLYLLSDYAIKHFFDEEKLMEAFGYKDLESHRLYHKDFVDTWKSFMRDFIMNGSSSGAGEKAEKYIQDWLTQHIKGHDIKWAKELKVKNPEVFSGRVFTPPCQGESLRYVMDDSFLTGFYEADKQHMELFNLVNKIAGVHESGGSFDSVKQSLAELSDYTAKHFVMEELLLRHNDYSDYENHRNFHTDFSIAVKELVREFIMTGVSDSIVSKIQSRAANWLIEHIKGEDLRWASELKIKVPKLFASAKVPNALS